MKIGTTDARLRLKATPPRGAKWLFHRAPLSLMRPEFHGQQVLMVNAPAGFGKTSLLIQWRREWLAAGAIVAWLTADDGDDPVRFSEALAASMDMASGRRAFGRIGHRATFADGEIDRLTEWLAEVTDLGVESALIIDEADRLPAETVLQSLHYLLSNLPPNLYLAIGSRSRLDLPLADLVARGQLMRIGAEALRFALPETIAIMQARFGARLDPDACARLHDLCEGWPLGLQLAVATLQKGPNPRDLLAVVSARTGDIRHYFVESLMARLPARMTDFLVRIAVVDRIHPELCTALTGCADAAGLLEDLRMTTPIFAEGVDSEWATIHLLAREFLLERYDQLPAAERQAIHASAARWLADHGLLEEAARHALRAGNPEAAAAFAEQSLFDLFLTGRASGVIEWIDRLPPIEVEKRPRLLLAAGWARAMSVRVDEAEPYARRVLDNARADADSRYLAHLMLSAAAFYADRIDEAAKIVDEWLRSEPRSAAIRPHGINQVAMLALYRGNPAEARLELQQYGAPIPDGGLTYAAGIRMLIEGLTYLWEGQVVAAVDRLREGIARAESDTGRRGAIAAAMAGPLALSLWEVGNLDEAATTLVNRLDAIEYVAPPDALVDAYMASARLAAAGGEERRAFSLLEGLCALGESRATPRFMISALGEMIRMHAIKGRAETCATLLARLDGVFASFPEATLGLMSRLLRLDRAMAAARAATARRDWERVLDAATTAVALADLLRRSRDAIEIQLLKALAFRSSGVESTELLREAVGLAETYGLRRLLLDVPPEIAAWAAELAGPGAGAARSSPVVPVAAVRTPHVSPSALLTPKEREVLQFLGRRLSNKQIASALDVGDATVKWHLKNLFAKLGAGTREHALQRARMLGILEGI